MLHARARQAVPLPSHDYRDYLWLARIHDAVGDRLLRVTADRLRHTASRNVNVAVEDTRTRVQQVHEQKQKLQEKPPEPAALNIEPRAPN